MQLDSLQCYSPPTPLSLILFLCHSLPPLSSFLIHTHTHRWQEASTRVCPSCVSPGDEGYPQIPHYNNDTWNTMLCRWREMKKQNSKCVRASDVSPFIFYSLCSHVSIFVRSKESEDMLSKCGHQPWHQHLRDKMRQNAKKTQKQKTPKNLQGITGANAQRDNRIQYLNRCRWCIFHVFTVRSVYIFNNNLSKEWYKYSRIQFSCSSIHQFIHPSVLWCFSECGATVYVEKPRSPSNQPAIQVFWSDGTVFWASFTGDTKSLWDDQAPHPISSRKPRQPEKEIISLLISVIPFLWSLTTVHSHRWGWEGRCSNSRASLSYSALSSPQ